MVDGDSADNNVSKIEKKQRPRGVAVIAILQVIVGFLVLAVAFYNFNIFSTHIVPGGGAGIAQLFMSYGLVAVCVFSWFLGVGIWEGWHWTWLTVIVLDVLGVLYSFSGIIQMISLAEFSSLISVAASLSYVIPVLVVCSVELWYFNRKRTKDYFGK